MAVAISVLSASIGFVQKLSSSDKYGKASTVLKIVMGSLILLIGFYMFYLILIILERRYLLWHCLERKQRGKNNILLLRGNCDAEHGKG